MKDTETNYFALYTLVFMLCHFHLYAIFNAQIKMFFKCNRRQNQKTHFWYNFHFHDEENPFYSLKK